MNMLIQQDPGLERKKKLAAAMMQTDSGPVQHWTQGANRVASKLLGAYLGNQFDQQSSDRQNQAVDQINSVFASDSPDKYSELANVLSDYNPQLSTTMRMQELQNQQARQQQNTDRQNALQDKKDLMELDYQLRSKYPKPQTDMDKLIKMMQIEKLQADADKKKLDLKAAEKANEADQLNIQNAYDTALELSKHPGFKKIYGSFQGSMLSPNLGEDSVNADALRERLSNVLSMAARGQLKGQGSVSDSETKMLSNAQTMLNNTRISDEMAAQEVERVLQYLMAKGAQGPQLSVNDPPPPPGTSQDAMNSFMNNIDQPNNGWSIRKK